MTYLNDNIVFENDDTLLNTVEKTIHLFAGTSELKSKMKTLNVEYVKVVRGLKVVYIVRHSQFGRKEIKL